MGQKVRALGAALAVAMALAACGTTTTAAPATRTQRTTTTQAPSTTTPATTTTEPLPGPNACTASLSRCVIDVTDCTLASGGNAVHLAFTLTNYDKVADDYIVTVDASSGFGLGGASPQINDVEPHQTVSWSGTSPLTNPATSPPSCTVDDVMVTPA